MAITRSTYAPYQVLTAANVNTIQDNGAVQADSESEMQSLPTTVKQCYRKDRGVVFTRNSDGNWVGVPNFLRSDTAFVTTNANGDFAIGFSPAFPFNFYSATLTDASDPASLGAIIIKVTRGTSNRGQVTGRAYGTNGAALANVSIAVCYMAVGD